MLASAVGTVVGAAVMIVASAVAAPSDRAAALAVGYGVAFLVSTAVLAVALERRASSPSPHKRADLARIVLAGAATYAVMAVLIGALDPTSRAASLITVIVVAALGAALYALLLRVVTGARLRSLVTIDGG
jgi:hypothetical protein